MEINQLVPTVFVATAAFGLLAGFLILAFGKKIPRQGDWLVWIVHVAQFAAVIIGLVDFFDGSGQVRSRLVHWVLSAGGESGVISVGVIEDPLGLIFSLLAVLVFSVFMMARNLIVREPRAERIYAGCALASSGVSLAWLSASAWLAFFGILMASFGGLIALGCRSEDDEEADVAIRFGRDRLAGLLLILFGAFALTSFSIPLEWASGVVGQASGPKTAQTIAGATLLIVGLFLQFQTFPNLGWLVSRDRTPAFVRTILAQIPVAWASFALLVRLWPMFEEQGLFPLFAWISLGCALLTVVPGLFQKDLRQSHALWVSAGFAIAVVVLASAGPTPSLLILVGVVLGTASVSLAASALSVGGPAGAAAQTRATWTKVGCYMGLLSAAGMVGFAFSGGAIQWLAREREGWLSVVYCIGLFFINLLGCRVALSSASLKNTTQANWPSVLSAVVMGLFSLGILWTGSLSGGAIPQKSDQVLWSLVAHLGDVTQWSYEGEAFSLASLMYWSSFAASMVFGFWASSKKANVWSALQKALPRTSDFLSGGYRVDRLGSGFVRGSKAVGMALYGAIDVQLWGRWVPTALTAAIRGIAKTGLAVDRFTTRALNQALRVATTVPAKSLQLTQSGNVQWYLFFAFGFGAALLLNFLVS